MTTTLTLDKMSETIDILKAITNSENEAMDIFKYHDSDINKLITFVDDVVDGLRAVYSVLYNHEAEDVCLVNLIKCKDYFYSVGHEHWGDDNFIEGSYQAYDIVTGILDVNDRIKEVVESSFSESFIDLFSSREADNEIRVNIDMDDTQLHLNSVSPDVTDFFLFDYSSTAKGDQVVHMDWFDDEYLKQMVEGIQTYLDLKNKNK
ncbi:hypothetical protein LYSIN_01207 [Lysinibacillus sphaericus]|uniref:Uncharacterized protein n=1 Tax=Lysinibacillus sphaericus TaxID=1421 RepID=A0A2S5D039_LYSSH|nr:hypothetical protein [Lysinibacillus sphaericus]POZ56424.1 hypothetical protein LYSIN_01207 [Lysinibacillus sphaericus]